MQREDLELLAYGLLGGKGNLGQNLAQAGLLMQQGRKDREDRGQQKQQQEIANQMRQMQLQQAQEQMADQRSIADIAAKSFRPAQAQQTAPFQADTFPGEAPLQGLQTVTQQARPAQFDPQHFAMGLLTSGRAGVVPQGMQALQGLQKQGIQFDKADPSKFTPESIRKAQASGSYADLVPIEKPQDLSALVIKGPDGKPMVNPIAVQAKKEIAAAGAARVSVDNKQEGAFGKKMGENYAEEYTNLMKGDAAATSKITRFSRLGNLLDQAGSTGKFTPLAKDMASAARSLGLSVDETKLGTQEAIQALSNEIALTLRNPSGGAGMPGALSDKDREFLVSMVPGLGNTEQGNRVIVQTAIKLAERERQVAKLARDYKQRNGRFDDGFYQVLAEFSAQNPLFEDVAPQQAPQSGRVINFNDLPK